MRQYHNSNLSFIDMLFNALTVFAALFILTVMIINDPTHKTKNIDTKAKILITMSWDGKSCDDMDLWLLTPEPDKVGYTHTNGNIAHLDHDDVGCRNNMYLDKKDGQIHYIHFHQEVIDIRQKMEGHYAVDIMFYSRNENPETHVTSIGPQEVTVQVIQIDPAYQEIITKTVTLKEIKDWKTVVSFNVAGDDITGIDTETQNDFIFKSYGSQHEEQESPF